MGCKREGGCVVSTAAALTAALDNAEVSTIFLAKGNFGAIVMKSNKTIIGCPDAKVDYVDLNGAANVTLKGLTFDAATAGITRNGEDTRLRLAIVFNAGEQVPNVGARNIVIDGCTFGGSFTEGYLGVAIAFTDQKRGEGASGNITIKNCTFDTKNSAYDIYGHYCGASTAGYGDFAIEGNIFKTVNVGCPVYLGRYQSSVPVVVTGNTFETATSLDDAVYVQDHSNYGVSVDASNNTFAN